MSRLAQRIERLEGPRGKVTVLGVAPAHWQPERRDAELERLAREQGVTGDVEFVAIAQQWPAITEAEIGHVGDIRDLFEHVAKHGRRIGERRAA
ncbi:hypothetical protein [Roseivivax sediminis]|uniref:Uncharacterized protein n=1 Tax=Roseivivax sediminis TaxID=936889 RepID=A0A1I1U9C0_9RHOB|nr:hypothetical protein [Roseivivax sediminis]SFD67461.1 hypothetical protein SAMN04515678_102227 [Roseivivax sediminis]